METSNTQIYNASKKRLIKINWKLYNEINVSDLNIDEDLFEQGEKRRMMLRFHKILIDYISAKSILPIVFKRILALCKESGILEDLLREKVTIKRSNGKEVTYNTLLDFANERCKEIAKLIEEFKDTTSIIDNENLQPICESSKKVQTEQELSVSDSTFSTKVEPYFDSESGKENSIVSKKAIIAGIVLLVSSIVSYILKIYVIAVIAEIIGLACVCFALHNAVKPNTKIERVEDIEQPIVESFFESNINPKRVAISVR